MSAVCARTCVCVCACVCARARACVCVHVCVHTCMHVRRHTWMNVYVLPASCLREESMGLPTAQNVMQQTDTAQGMVGL